MTDQFDDHTLVINTFNRPQCLYRLLRFTALDLPVGRVLVVDGSNEPYRSQNREVAALFAERMPLRLEQLEAGISAVEQARLVPGLVETPFMTLCHDDNFFVHSTLRACIAYLRAHADYTACAGGTISFSFPDDRLSVSISEGAPLEQEDPLDRMSHFLADHWPADFATWRTAPRAFANAALDLYYRDETFAEPLHVALGALQGKFHVLPEISLIFCCHDSNLSHDALNRQFGPASPQFMDNVDAAAAVLTDCCTRLGIAPPDDPRRFVLRAHIHGMAYNPVLGELIGNHMRGSALDGLDDAQVADLDARMEAAIMDRLLQLPAADRAGIRASIADMKQDLRKHPVLFTKKGNQITLFDNPEVPWENEAKCDVTPSRTMPPVYRTFLSNLAAGTWAERYQQFRQHCLQDLIAPLDGNRDAEMLFAGTFLLALNRLIKPIYFTHNHAQGAVMRSVYFAGKNNLTTMNTRDLKVYLAAATYFDEYPTPVLDGSVEDLHARSIPGYRDFDYLVHSPAGQKYRRPGPDCVSRPVQLGEDAVMEKGNVCFVRVPPDPDIMQRLANGEAVWLTVELEAVEGCMQFGLYRNDSLDQLQVAFETETERRLAFSLGGAMFDFLVLRDVSPAPAVGRCQISGLHWTYYAEQSTSEPRKAAAA